jgi:hypothetical protein
MQYFLPVFVITVHLWTNYLALFAWLPGATVARSVQHGLESTLGHAEVQEMVEISISSIATSPVVPFIVLQSLELDRLLAST